MNAKKEKEQECDCTADLMEEIDELVDNVEGYSQKDHKERKKEVEEAFKNDQKK